MPPGRPKEITPKPVEYPKLTSAQIAQIAPLNKNGLPDLMNYMPTRLIPFAEAQARGWIYFYDGSACRKGHVAPRFVSNKDQCVDCRRVERGRQPIGRAAGEPPRQKYVLDGKHSTNPTAAAVARDEQQPDRTEKQFLLAYAETKDFDKACSSIGVTPAHMMMRAASSGVFRIALADLENRAGITHIPPVSEDYEWTESKRNRFIEIFVDMGDIATARDSINVTPSEYYREMMRNSDFATSVIEATKLAANVLEERATQLALAGNDKLLIKVLSAKKPEQYGDRLNLNMKVEQDRFTDDQLRSDIIRTIRNGRIIDSTAIAVDGPAGAIEAPSAGEGTSETQISEQIRDLL